MDEPAIKGTVLAGVVDDLAARVEQGRVAREAVEARLEAGDLALLEEKVQPALWYSIAAYERLACCLWELDGGGRDEYMRERGRGAARRLREAGVYRQLTREARHLALPELRRTLSLWSAMVSFSTWDCEEHPGEPGAFRIRVRDGAAFPRVLRVANQGFLEEVFSHITAGTVRVELDDGGRDRFDYVLRVA